MAKIVKKGRPSKRSIAMKKAWIKRRAIQEANERRVVTVKEPKLTMQVRVISHQDGLQIDNYDFDGDKFGELMDCLHRNYMGIKISEVLIQIK